MRTEQTIAAAQCLQKRQQLDRLPDGSGHYLAYATDGTLLADAWILPENMGKWLERFHRILHRPEWTVWLKAEGGTDGTHGGS